MPGVGVRHPEQAVGRYYLFTFTTRIRIRVRSDTVVLDFKGLDPPIMKQHLVKECRVKGGGRVALHVGPAIGFGVRQSIAVMKPAWTNVVRVNGVYPNWQ